MLSVAQKKHSKATAKFLQEHVEFVTRRGRVKVLLGNLAKDIDQHRFIVFDTETTGLDPWSGEAYLWSYGSDNPKKVNGDMPFLFQIGYFHEDREKFYILLIPVEDKELFKLSRVVLESLNTVKVGHNIKFDVLMANRVGIDVRGKLWDTLTASRLTHDRLPSHSLKYLGNFFSGHMFDGKKSKEDEWEEDIKAWLKKERSAHTRKGFPKNYINYSTIPKEMMEVYALKDVWYTYLLFTILEPIIDELYGFVFDLDSSALRIAVDMEKRGLRVAAKKSLKLAERVSMFVNEKDLRIKRICKLRKIPSINPASPKSVKEGLVHLGEIIGIDELSSLASTDKEALTSVASLHPIPQLVLDRRALDKVKGTYLLPLAKRADTNGLVHCQLGIDTATGRFNCRQPNLQNIPRPSTDDSIPMVRSIFIPSSGEDNYYFDYSQIELVVFAMFCREHAMLEAIARGEDLHGWTAKMLFGRVTKEGRQFAKSINFGIIYGMGDRRLAAAIGKSIGEAKELREHYYNIFPKIESLLHLIDDVIKTQGYIQDIFGRRYHIPHDRTYIGVNSLVQGCSAGVLKCAMVQTQRALEIMDLEEYARLLLCIHDEQNIGVVKNVPLYLLGVIKVAMECITPMWAFDVKPKVEIEMTRTNWSEKKDFSLPKRAIAEAKKKMKPYMNEIVLDYPSPDKWFMR